MPVPNTNRRKEPRFRVGWTATLTCYSADHEENVEARVTEISMNGARLQLKSLQVGPHHIVIGSESIRFTLKLSRPETAFSAPVSIVWYSSGREKDSFDIGVMFLQSSDKRRAAVEKLWLVLPLNPIVFSAKLSRFWTFPRGSSTAVMRSKDYKAILFDIDGTLLDTLEDMPIR